jgi:hypothetical protein
MDFSPIYSLRKSLLLAASLLFVASSPFITVSMASALEVTQKFCVYAKKSYKGEELCGNQEKVNWLGLTWAREISSLQVANDYELIGYTYPFLLGEPIVLSGDVEKLSSNWNNRISSFELRSKMADQQGVCFYSKKNYNGRRFCTDESSPLISLSWYKQISSISIPAGKQVTLYKYWFFNSAINTLDVSAPKLKGSKLRFFSYQIEDVNADTDADSDGIDQCPDTLLGEAVDANGCALSQLDTDVDGVSDAIDQCANTQSDQSVNAEGCSLIQLDIDSDGLNDAVDQCPATPQGESANAAGCSPSQLDADNDGVSDAIDQCSDTPAQESVNFSGCALIQIDSDRDGTNDVIDQCPSTPINESVNFQGCSLSQLDTDQDGVNDALDQCPISPVAEPVDPDGCASVPIETHTVRRFIYDNNGQMTADDVQGSVE